MRLVVGGDHAGYRLKGPVIRALSERGHDVVDVGTNSLDPVDFPDIAQRLTTLIVSGDADRGIMVCGTGVGAAIAANKVPGIRAAVCHDLYSAHQCVEHDDVNVLCLGAQIIGELMALELVSTYLEARFADTPEFRARVEKLAQLDEERTRRRGPSG